MRAAATLAVLVGTALSPLPAHAVNRSATTAKTVTVDGRQAEKIDRGLVAVPTDAGVLVSWRLLTGKDPAFHVYRNGRRITQKAISKVSNYTDTQGKAGDRYAIAPVGGTRTAAVTAWDTDHLDIPLDKPGEGYKANDASVGDLDGDGQYEIVLKWDPAVSKDNSQSGVTGEVYLDAYELTGEKLWRIALGRNIRAGAHYTQFLVYDLDGNGRSEIVMKTADGTVDGKGVTIGDASADYRNSAGYVLTGPEYLTVFDGRTGGALNTSDYEPPRGTVTDWGDGYGNRVDRFLAGVAYLDGERPSFVMARGYYTRTVLVAYDWRGGKLTERWTFDSNVAGKQYEGQGNHELSVADVDDDGKDEIVYGALTLDDDGSVLYSTGLGHGDALHVGDLDPEHPGLEVFGVHESKSAAYGLEMHDADTGEILFGRQTGLDTGRGLSADIDPSHPGEEVWAVNGAWNSPTGWLYSAQGELISNTIPSANFAIWWDGDLNRELLDHDWDATTETGVGTIGKWDPETETTENLLTATGTLSNNHTKGTPSLQADILGDWREEVLWRSDDSTSLRLYSTPYSSRYGFTTLMRDPVYRLGIAWQNVAYNQPPHTSFYLGTK
ncbi:rhamnogalacturonan lyase [Kineosporia sp. J2-2]|uniref:Rhamnogalacturonan lyase n=2 Tax=Kineosporia corallincola TaxID=2835133 RepID=A0ABS5TBI9_9ACTN|nr:rhamnogalacturonan lyase [Kineosporia corallincola]